MSAETKIGIETFKTVTKAIAESDNLDLMSNHLTQLLVAAMDIKGCAIYVLNPETEELEILASFGLSPEYLVKGPLSAAKSIRETFKGVPIIVPDVSKNQTLQYPKEALKEGIAALLSIPIIFSSQVIGVLRLYHHEVWHISDEDLDSLSLLGEIIGLAMTYARFSNAIYSINEIINSLST